MVVIILEMCSCSVNGENGIYTIAVSITLYLHLSYTGQLYSHMWLHFYVAVKHSEGVVKSC